MLDIVRRLQVVVPAVSQNATRSPCPNGGVYELFSCSNHSEADTGLLNEILLGLTSEKKTLPSKLLYDATVPSYSSALPSSPSTI